MTETHEVTQLLGEWAKGNQKALDELTPLVYRELRRLAAIYLRRERPGHTLQPTALVHEAYMRLVDQTHPNWQNRAHFLCCRSAPDAANPGGSRAPQASPQACQTESRHGNGGELRAESEP